MFQVLECKENNVSKLIDVKVSYQSNVSSETLIDGGTFSRIEAAEHWINSTKKFWFGVRLDNFLIAVRNALETATGHKSITNKKEVLTELFRFAKWTAETDDLKQTCKWFVLEKEKFFFVLPPSTNDSRATLEKELQLLTNFIETEIKHSLIKIAS